MIRVLLFVSVFCVGGLSACAQSSNQNYILTRTYLDSARTKYMDDIQYVDGLGRLSESVQRKVTPSGQDLVSLQEYDTSGRPANKWLPGTSSYDGAFVAPATLKIWSDGTNGDSAPYDSLVYDGSPLDRVVERYGPGSSWHVKYKGAGHSAKTSYMTNMEGVDTLNCVLYKVNHTNFGSDVILNVAGDYASGSLLVTRTTDEDGNPTFTFKDKQGRLVLSRKLTIDHSSSTVKKTLFDTNYVYDDAGNLTVVLPPLASDALTAVAKTWSSSEPTIQKYAYLYMYDNRNRVCRKYLPGAMDWVYYVYDRADNLILSQDPEQRKRGEWTFTIPDKLGRDCVTGICTGSDYGTLNNAISSQNVYVTRTNATDALKGYAVSGFTITNPIPMKVNYYDDYDFIGQNGVGTGVAYDAQAGYDTRYANAKGKPTGSVTKNLDDWVNPQYFYSATYYDKFGRIIQTKEPHLLGGMDANYTAYNFTGQPTSKKHIHTSNRAATQTEVYTYTYDNALRLIDTRYSLNGAEAIDLAANTYDDLGRLKTQDLGGTATSKTTYGYNVRSWIGSVESPLFKEYLNRQAGSARPAFNGNISAMKWMIPSDGKGMRAYEFAYDGLGRLTSAGYTGDGSYGSSYAYDKMGNITQAAQGGSAVSNGYDGNHASGRSYDSNGNLTKDLNKNIGYITYNFLNLPNVISIGGANHSFIYDADGRKLYSNTNANGYGGAPNDETHYCQDVIYRNWKIDRITLDGGYGYVTFTGDNATGAPVYHFYQKDHLGSNRLVVNKGGTIEQVSHYYPYGMSFAEGTNNSGNQYKYNGKELDTTGGLNLYDYGARYMDPALGRFTTMDPMAEKYYDISPYAYAGDNPVNNIDPNGMDWVEHLYNGSYEVYYDRSVTSQADVNKKYGEDAGYTRLGDGSTYTVRDEDGNITAQYTFKNDSKENKYGTVTDMNGNQLNNYKITDVSGATIFGASDNSVNAETLHKNWMGSYIGPNNPKDYDGNDSYQYKPTDSPTDMAAYRHDQAYDALGAKGISGALNPKTTRADMQLMNSCEQVLNNPNSNPVERSRAKNIINAFTAVDIFKQVIQDLRLLQQLGSPLQMPIK